MDGQQHSFIFIPDITGFSSFVKETEVSHSQHIISELIALIIESDTLGLEVAEVEGDAVLFYKHKTVPDYDALMKQIEKTYLAFHAHLLQYEKYRICTCGACSTASKLSLKFIAHCGEIGFIDVQGNKKPHGREIVVVHRLLKNNVESPSYALLSETLSKEYELDSSWQKDTKNDSDLGEIDYYYTDLANLDNKVPQPDEFVPPDRILNPMTSEIEIKTDIDMLSEAISNFSFREKWQTGIDRLIYREDEVNRLGTQHVCVINNRELDFETVAMEREEDHRVIGERTKNPPFFKELVTYYILDKLDDHVRLKVEVHYFQRNIISRIMTPFFKMGFQKNIGQNLKSLKKYIEEWNSESPKT